MSWIFWGNNLQATMGTYTNYLFRIIFRQFTVVTNTIGDSNEDKKVNNATK